MDELVQTLVRLSPLAMAIWALIFVAWLGAVVWVLRREHRSWQARGKGGSALGLRIASLPILIITVLVVVVPVRSISGMEALFWFYVALATLAPLCWFGLHGLLGRIGRPPLTLAESSEIAGLGVAIVLSPFLVATALQMPVYHLLRAIG